MRVEAGRHQEQLRVEPLDRRHDPLVERQEVLLVAGAGAQWNVHGRVALFVRPAGSGIEGPLVQRDEEHRVVRPEDLLRAVPVMNVVVDDRDSADAVLGLHVTGGDRDVVDEAEAHRGPWPCVMPRRPHQGEGSGLGRLHRNAGCE